MGMAIRFAALAAGWNGSKQETARQYLAEARGTRSYWLKGAGGRAHVSVLEPHDKVPLRDRRRMVAGPER